MDLFTGERATVLSNSNGILSSSIQESLRPSQAKLGKLAVTLDGFIGQDSELGGNTNKIKVPMVEEDLALLRHFVAAAIELGEAPRITQPSANFFAHVLSLLKQAKIFLEATKDTVEGLTLLIITLTATAVALAKLLGALI